MSSPAKAATPSFDVDLLRAQFPALSQEVRGKQLIYLDSAATALKPQCVIDAVAQVYERDCGNIHRAVHLPSQRATQSFEATRESVRSFLNAEHEKEIIFTSGTTASINMLAQCYGRGLKAGDKILVTGLEHHSNIVPWQLLCEQVGTELVVAQLDEDGDVPLDRIEALLKAGGVKVVAFAYISNALGTVLPAKKICAMAREYGAISMIDGAQAVPHLDIDVRDLGCDFYAFSGHKLYAPTGTGVLYGRFELLNSLPPYQGGGDMIRNVSFEKTTYAELPNRLEAGTPNIAGVIGLGAALSFLNSIDRAAARAHEEEVFRYADKALREIPGLRRIGTAKHSIGALSFVMDNAHPHDIGTIVDMEGVALRTGHHCAQPVMKAFSVPATARASLGIYTNFADIDALIASVRVVQEMFS
ncbi:MAG: cysteine desulfurase [Kofleriaceae bacterium]|nr:cysteine desulfurase [Kofleriaceae bacterium]